MIQWKSRIPIQREKGMGREKDEERGGERERERERKRGGGERNRESEEKRIVAGEWEERIKKNRRSGGAFWLEKKLDLQYLKLLMRFFFLVKKGRICLSTFQSKSDFNRTQR